MATPYDDLRALELGIGLKYGGKWDLGMDLVKSAVSNWGQNEATLDKQTVSDKTR